MRRKILRHIKSCHFIVAGQDAANPQELKLVVQNIETVR